MALGCLGLSGQASGSVLAAAVLALPSSAVGISTAGRFAVFDMAFHLATIGTAEADDSARFASIDKCNAIRNVDFLGESNRPRLAVLESFVGAR
jgi:hypothetical protein